MLSEKKKGENCFPGVPFQRALAQLLQLSTVRSTWPVAPDVPLVNRHCTGRPLTPQPKDAGQVGPTLFLVVCTRKGQLYPQGFRTLFLSFYKPAGCEGSQQLSQCMQQPRGLI